MSTYVSIRHMPLISPWQSLHSPRHFHRVVVFPIKASGFPERNKWNQALENRRWKRKRFHNPKKALSQTHESTI